MRNKVRYQVFVSSTFRDLVAERQAVLNAILRMGHFPAGMEMFPGSDSDAWSIIERVISESDIYLLIIGGKYGTIDSGVGISYTEKEFDFAISMNKPIVVFPHGDPNAIVAGKSELDATSRKMLDQFRARAELGRHRRTWLDAKDLMYEVTHALQHVMETNDLRGWTRTDEIDSTELLKQLNDVRSELAATTKERDSLRQQIDSQEIIEGIACGDDSYTLLIGEAAKPGKESGAKEQERLVVTWDEIFLAIAEKISHPSPEHDVRSQLNHRFAPQSHVSWASFEAIKRQMLALGLIEFVRLRVSSSQFMGQANTQYETNAWKLTGRGQAKWLRIAAIRKPNLAQ